jgi:hypothetical protein
MNEQDKEVMEALYAAFAMVGFMINGVPTEDLPALCKSLAKEMMKSGEGLEGIIKRKAL